MSNYRERQRENGAEQYPKRSSEVTLTFIDGEVKEYQISAGSGISPFLAKQAGETGVLVLLNGEVTYNIPVSQIKEYEIRELAAEGQPG